MLSGIGIRFPALALVRRELLTSLRSVRALVILLIFSVGAMWVIIESWPSGADGLNWVGYMSRSLVQVLSTSLFAGCILLVPAYASGAIGLERERSTYDFLRMSLISPLGIVMAKLWNAVGIFLMVLVAMLPVMSTAFFLIGVDYTVFVWATVVIAMTTVTCASIALACSSIFQKSITTIAMSYVGVVMLMIGPMLLAYLFAAIVLVVSNIRSVSSIVEGVAEHTSPVMTFAYALEVDGMRDQFAFGTGIAYQLLVTVLCLAIAWWNVRRPPKPPKVSEEKPIDDVAVLRQRKVGFPFYILDPMKRKKPIEDRRNPMMIREIRWGLMNRGTILIRVFYVSFVVYFILGAMASLDARDYSGMREWLIMQTVLTLMAAPGLIANSLTKEYELGNLDMLRMTLLRPKDIIVGKYTAGFASVSPLLCAAVLSCVPVIVMGMREYEILLVGYANLMVCVVLSISIGLFSSMLTRQTSVAIMISYVLSLFFFVGVAFLVDYFNLDADEGLYSPVMILYEVIDAPSRGALEIAYTKWLGASAITLGISACMVVASVAIFLRFKMQDR